MPLWQIFHTAAAFTQPNARAYLAGNITGIYTAAGLPSFYVNVLFQPIAVQDMWIGGRPAASALTACGGAAVMTPTSPRITATPNSDGDDEKVDYEVRAPLERPFVRMSIQHVAIHRGGNETAMVDMCDRIVKVIAPHLEGYDWEYAITEPDPLLWRINGLQPPPHGSPAEKVWIDAGRPSPWQ